MARPEDEREFRPLPQAVEARVTHPAPAVATDPLFVVVPAFSLNDRFGPCAGWEPRGARLPVVGDRALLVLADDGGAESAWVPCWTPAP